MHTKIWAHRGSSHTQIENSMAAFRQAIKDGADGVELDVQRTKDGKLIVFHDEKLNRLTDLDQCVWEVSWAEIQTLTLGGTSEKIPSLEEVLKLFQSTALTLNIELKNSHYFYPGMEQEIFDLVNKYKMNQQVLYSSFNHESMRKMANIVGGKYCAILTSDIQVEPWDYIKSVGVEAYHPMINSMQQRNLIQNIRKNGLNVNVWTADHPAHIYAALLIEVDAIITNEPKRAVELRAQFQTDGGQKAVEAVRALGYSIPK